MKEPVSASESRIERFRSSDGEFLACRIWQGETSLAGSGKNYSGQTFENQQPKPVVLYLHGIEGHSQWFSRTAEVLSACGITVYAPDRRGAGLNSAERGHLSSYKRYLADLETVLKSIARDQAGCPIVIMGNCWGAKAAVVICSDEYRAVDGPLDIPIVGLILTSPAIHTKADLDWRTKLNVAFSCILGDGRELKQFPIPLTVEMFTNERSFLEYIQSDTMRLTTASCRFYFETFMLSRACRQASRRLSLPLFTIQSGNDAVVDSDKVIAWHDKLNCPNKRLRVFPNAAHSIDFELNDFDVYTTDLKEWLFTLTSELSSVSPSSKQSQLRSESDSALPGSTRMQ